MNIGVPTLGGDLKWKARPALGVEIHRSTPPIPAPDPRPVHSEVSAGLFGADDSGCGRRSRGGDTGVDGLSLKSRASGPPKVPVLVRRTRKVWRSRMLPSHDCRCGVRAGGVRGEGCLGEGNVASICCSCICRVLKVDNDDCVRGKTDGRVDRVMPVRSGATAVPIVEAVVRRPGMLTTVSVVSCGQLWSPGAWVLVCE